MFENSPLYRAVSGYAAQGYARFHMPGHKGTASPLREAFRDLPSLDVTELDETDSLYDASGAILEAERRAAAAFGMRDTLFSAGGATLCIQAMLRMVSNPGRKKIVMARNIHRSAVNALCLLDLEPVWVWPRGREGSSLPGEICAEDVETALEKNGDAAAVYLTSPDYYGVLSDIGVISRVCRRYGIPLLVDNAHGAHLLCLDGGKLHPLHLGASLSCDSAHKMLPVLTGGAWLQLGEGFDRREAKNAMSLFGSTSPSYPIMLSLDLAREWMEREGNRAFEELRKKVAEIRDNCRKLGFSASPFKLDPVRITLDTASVGRDGGEAARILKENGVSIEMHDDRHVVLLPSPFNPDRDFERLADALPHLPAGPAVPVRPREQNVPEKAATPRQAMDAPSVEVDSASAAGKIAAECRCPCPPGIPLVMPGERISDKLVNALKNYGVKSLKVVK